MDSQLFDLARTGDTAALAAQLDRHPDGLYARTTPYELSLLHLAAGAGHLSTVELLLARGLDPNVRDQGDNSTAMHWAAANGSLEVVRSLADAGGDIVGHGDDHALDVIGWATCWEQCHSAVADFLVGRGARHHIFSAIAMDLAAEVRRIVSTDPESLSRRMTRNEDHRMPLHFAVLKQRPAMVSLLLELGADPLAVDGSGVSAAAYATSPAIDRGIMEAIHAMTAAELTSAMRGQRQPRVDARDLVASLALGDQDTAARLLRDNPGLLDGGGALHLMAKRNDIAAVTWLLDRGANPNARWLHWDAELTPLHLAAAQGHAEVVRLLLNRGADPTQRDGKHGSDPLGWAEYFGQPDIVRLLEPDRPAS